MGQSSLNFAPDFKFLLVSGMEKFLRMSTAFLKLTKNSSSISAKTQSGVLQALSMLWRLRTWDKSRVNCSFLIIRNSFWLMPSIKFSSLFCIQITFIQIFKSLQNFPNGWNPDASGIVKQNQQGSLI